MNMFQAIGNALDLALEKDQSAGNYILIAWFFIYLFTLYN